MVYSKGYKYRLEKDIHCQTLVCPIEQIQGRLILLETTGKIWVRAGYAWDGASGPTIDSDTSMKASLVHDALYQLIRKKLLPGECRVSADLTFKEICINEGMWKWRASIWYKLVVKFGKNASSKPRRLYRVGE